jgi:uncharacterized membrane protein
MSEIVPLIARSRVRWLLTGAGAALVAAQAVLPVMPGDATEQVSVVSAHRGAVLVSAPAFLVAGALLVLGMSSLNSVPVARSRKVTAAGLVLTGVGAAWPIAGRAAFNLVMAAITDGAGRPSAVAAAHAITTSNAFVPLLLTLVAFALGPIVLTVGLWRAGVVPPWPAVLWLVGVVVVNAAEASSRPVTMLGMVTAASALCWLGTAVGGVSGTEHVARVSAAASSS